jgi:biopolymer transport protein ExbD
MTTLLPLGTGRWLKTLRFQPVNVPVSLLVGHIQTTEFETNLRGDYNVQFDVDYEIYYRAVEPCSATALRDVHWTLYRFGGGAAKKRYLWATNKNPTGDGFVVGFHGPSGKYQLQWDIPAEAACLNSGHPQLEIYTSSEMYQQVDSFVRHLSLLFGGAGVMLVLRGLGVMLWGRLVGTRPLRMLPELTIRNVLPARKGNPARPIVPMTQLSIFSFMWGGVLSVLAFVYMIFLEPPMHHGLFVQIHERGGTVWLKSPWPKSVSVYVGGDGGYYVNGQLVRPELLQAKLKDELGKEMMWTVYLEADESTSFSRSIYAIGAIQGLGAKVVWITPNIRAELNRK